jgi:hypothetical protein
MCDQAMCRSGLCSLRVLFLVFVLLSIPGCATLKAQPKAEFSKAVQIFGEEKSKAEQWASMLKSGKWQPQSKEYVDGVKLYIDAKSAFDGLIARLRTDPSARDIEEQIVSASKKSSRFSHYVYVLHNPDSQLAWSTATKELIDAGLEIWKVYREAEKETRDDIRKELERLVWEPFDKIAASK